MTDAHTQPTPPDTLALAERLARAESTTLTPAEAALLARALEELAAAQSLLALQAALLASHGEDLAAIDAHTRAALAAARGTHPANGYDFAAGQAARRALAESLRRAASLEDTLGAILAFVRAGVGLLA
ncbi:MAG: hypothetical protein IBJ11_10090 [Phycisphaerales bacterium]|nr:hypothetical protein [Phycisphaerales bacterium]